MAIPLPLEIHHFIIQQIDDKSDLCSLALCCSAFRSEAQWCLFHEAKPATIVRRTQFLSAINGEPLRLALLVHTFYIDGRDSNDDFYASLSQALHAMHCLKHLRLFWLGYPSTVMHGCTFQLCAFGCIFPLNRREALFLLCDFLPTQKSFKRLEMYVNNPGLIEASEVPNDPCPQLESLLCNEEGLVKILLPDARPIPDFRWFNADTPPPLTIYQLNHVKSLKLRFLTSGPNPAFAVHLTSLVTVSLDAILWRRENLSHIVSI